MSATNDDCGALFGAHRCDACGTSIIYPLGSVPEPCQRCRIAALESELAASQAREARLREALTELERAASSILEHARFNRADTAPGAQHNSRIARANRAVREARAALAADKDEDHGTTD